MSIKNSFLGQSWGQETVLIPLLVNNFLPLGGIQLVGAVLSLISQFFPTRIAFRENIISILTSLAKK